MHDDNKFYYILLHNLNKNGAENYFYGKMVFKQQQQQNVSTKSDTIDTTPETWLKNSCKIFILFRNTYIWRKFMVMSLKLYFGCSNGWKNKLK